jgi:hypothetical protein
MTLFSLMLEILAETMMLLSAPRLLDRVLTQLCKPSLRSLTSVFVILIHSPYSCAVHIAWVLPLGAGIA